MIVALLMAATALTTPVRTTTYTERDRADDEVCVELTIRLSAANEESRDSALAVAIFYVGRLSTYDPNTDWMKRAGAAALLNIRSDEEVRRLGNACAARFGRLTQVE